MYVNMECIKVSVIIPAYNTEKYIDNMLYTVVNQTHKNIEIIIINDGSEDSTLEKIKNWEKRDARIICIDIPNGGGIKCKKYWHRNGNRAENIFLGFRRCDRVRCN